MGHSNSDNRKPNSRISQPYSDTAALHAASEWPNDLSVKSVNPAENSVLVIDDDPEQLRFLTKVIERAGYKVIPSSSATEALDVLSDKSVDVIVSDYKMPEMNGFEFLQALRSLDTEWPADETPVIMLTACGDDLEFVALERGADMFCEKFRADSLLVKQIRFLLEM